MNESETLHNLLHELGLEDRPECVSVDQSDHLRPQERHFLDWGRDKIKADAVVFQRVPVSDSVFPLVYIRRLQDSDPTTIAEAHRLAWNMGRAPLLFLVVPGRILDHSA